MATKKGAAKKGRLRKGQGEVPVNVRRSRRAGMTVISAATPKGRLLKATTGEIAGGGPAGEGQDQSETRLR